MTKMDFLMKKWEIEKWTIKTTIGVVAFATLMLVDEVTDFLGEIIDEIGDFVYDNSGMSHSEAETLVGVVIIYTLIVACDRIGHKLIPFIAKKMFTKKTKTNNKTEVPE